MLRCGLALALTLGAFVGCQQVAAAQSISSRPSWRALPVVAATSRKTSKAHAPENNAQSIPPLPERKGAQHGPAAAELKQNVWLPSEIEAAKARCTKLLKDIEAEVIAQPPIREGRCGAPAPIRLVGLGSKPQVRFSPPALINCDMAVALHQWVRNDLQPLAIKHLGAPIVTVEVMSDYSCRTSSGRLKNRLSEHAFADALDIRGFVTAKGKAVRVLDIWGPTQRDIAAAEAAKNEAAKAKAEQKVAGASAPADKAAEKILQDAITKAAAAPAATGSTQSPAAAGLVKRTRADGRQTFALSRPGRVAESLKVAAARLGGPPEAHRAEEGAPKLAALSPATLIPGSGLAPATGPRALFLRDAHAAACRIFGTTLGPEANEAHRNHFHVDMAERKYKKICD